MICVLYACISTPCISGFYNGHDVEYGIVICDRYGGFNIGKSTISDLRKKFPLENFPKHQFDDYGENTYKKNKIRLNPSLCYDVQCYPGVYNLVVKKIPKYVLYFPSCWTINEYDGQESIVVDYEKLQLLLKEKAFEAKQKSVKNIIDNPILNSEEKLTQIKEAFAMSQLDTAPAPRLKTLPNSDYDSAKSKTAYKKIIRTLVKIPELDDLFKKDPLSFYQTD